MNPSHNHINNVENQSKQQSMLKKILKLNDNLFELRTTLTEPPTSADKKHCIDTLNQFDSFFEEVSKYLETYSLAINNDSVKLLNSIYTAFYHFHYACNGLKDIILNEPPARSKEYNRIFIGCIETSFKYLQLYNDKFLSTNLARQLTELKLSRALEKDNISPEQHFLSLMSFALALHDIKAYAEVLNGNQYCNFFNMVLGKIREIDVSKFSAEENNKNPLALPVLETSIENFENYCKWPLKSRENDNNGSVFFIKKTIAQPFSPELLAKNVDGEYCPNTLSFEEIIEKLMNTGKFFNNISNNLENTSSEIIEYGIFSLSRFVTLRDKLRMYKIPLPSEILDLALFEEEQQRNSKFVLLKIFIEQVFSEIHQSDVLKKIARDRLKLRIDNFGLEEFGTVLKKIDNHFLEQKEKNCKEQTILKNQNAFLMELEADEKKKNRSTKNKKPQKKSSTKKIEKPIKKMAQGNDELKAKQAPSESDVELKNAKQTKSSIHSTKKMTKPSSKKSKSTKKHKKIKTNKEISNQSFNADNLPIINEKETKELLISNKLVEPVALQIKEAPASSALRGKIKTTFSQIGQKIHQIAFSGKEDSVEKKEETQEPISLKSSLVRSKSIVNLKNKSKPEQTGLLKTALERSRSLKFEKLPEIMLSQETNFINNEATKSEETGSPKTPLISKKLSTLQRSASTMQLPRACQYEEKDMAVNSKITMAEKKNDNAEKEISQPAFDNPPQLKRSYSGYNFFASQAQNHSQNSNMALAWRSVDEAGNVYIWDMAEPKIGSTGCRYYQFNLKINNIEQEGLFEIRFDELLYSPRMRYLTPNEKPLDAILFSCYCIKSGNRNNEKLSYPIPPTLQKWVMNAYKAQNMLFQFIGDGAFLPQRDTTVADQQDAFFSII